MIDMAIRSRRVLVTGGAGFLGSHLCERLVADGHHVICLDNFSSGARANVSHLLGNPAFELIEHDVTSPIALAVDRIYNLACPASPPQYQKDSVHTTKTCVLGAMHLLDLAQRTSARILQASTSEVYGDPAVHPQPETYWGNVNPVGVRSCYDEGKRCAESLFFDYHRQHGVNIRVARIFNTYGPRMQPDDGRVVSNFIAQALSGAPITVFGEGTQTRCFCYVDDMIDGLVALMDHEADEALPVNLGNPVEMGVRELAERVIALAGSKSTIVFKPLPADDPRRRRPDIGTAKRLLNWQPKVSLDEGLRRTLAYAAQRMSSFSA